MSADYEVKGVIADSEIEPDRLAGEQALQVVDAVFAQAPGDEREIGQKREARLGRGLREAAAPNADVDPDRIRLEGRLLQVEANAVGELDQIDAKVVDMFVASDRAGRSKIRVGKGRTGEALGRLQRHRSAGFVDAGDDLLGGGGFLCQINIAGHKDIALVDGPPSAEGAQTVIGRDFFERWLEQREIGIRVGEHLVAQQAGDEFGGKFV